MNERPLTVAAARELFDHAIARAAWEALEFYHGMHRASYGVSPLSVPRFFWRKWRDHFLANRLRTCRYTRMSGSAGGALSRYQRAGRMAIVNAWRATMRIFGWLAAFHTIDGRGVLGGSSLPAVFQTTERDTPQDYRTRLAKNQVRERTSQEGLDDGPYFAISCSCCRAQSSERGPSSPSSSRPLDCRPSRIDWIIAGANSVGRNTRLR